MVAAARGPARRPRRRRAGRGSAYPVDAVEWQTWANPEFMQFDTGLRLEFQPPEVREAALALMRASLSPEGYELAHAMMLINGFLGEIVGLETDSQRVQLQHRALRRTRPAGAVGLAALRSPLRRQLPGRRRPDGAVPGLPGRRTQRDRRRSAGRRRVVHRADRARHRADGRAARRSSAAGPRSTSRWSTRPCHPAGCIPATNGTWPGRSRTTGSSRSRASGSPTCPSAAQELVMAIVEQFVLLLPPGPRAARLREISEHLTETWFSLDRWAPARRRLLLPHPVAGRHRRTRPPLRRLPRLRHPAAVPHPHRAADPARQRLRPGLRPAVATAAIGLTTRSSASLCHSMASGLGTTGRRR